MNFDRLDELTRDFLAFYDPQNPILDMAADGIIISTDTKSSSNREITCEIALIFRDLQRLDTLESGLERVHRLLKSPIGTPISVCPEGLNAELWCDLISEYFSVQVSRSAGRPDRLSELVKLVQHIPDEQHELKHSLTAQLVPIGIDAETEEENIRERTKKLKWLAEQMRFALCWKLNVHYPKLGMIMTYTILLHNMERVLWTNRDQNAADDQVDTLVSGFFNTEVNQDRYPRGVVAPIHPKTPIEEIPDSNKKRQLQQVLYLSPIDIFQSFDLCQAEIDNVFQFELSRFRYDFERVLRWCIDYLRFRQSESRLFELRRVFSNAVEKGQGVGLALDDLLEYAGERFRDRDLRWYLDLIFWKCWYLFKGGNPQAALERSRQIVDQLSQTEGYDRHAQAFAQDVSALLLDPARIPPRRRPLSELADSMRFMEVVVVKQLPSLINVMNHLLEAHSEWFRKQSEPDAFEGLLAIPQLKQHHEPQSIPVSTKPAGSTTNEREPPLSTLMNVDEISSLHSKAEEMALDKESVELVMGCLGCTEVEAIALLMRNNCRVQDALDSLFGGAP